MDRLLQLGLKRFIRRGSLRVQTADGDLLEFGDGSGKRVSARFTRRSALARLLLRPELRLGEAYMNGDLVLDEGNIAELLAILMSQESSDPIPFLARPQASASQRRSPL